MGEERRFQYTQLMRIIESREILSVLTDSQKTSGMVGVNAPLLGPLTCITAVEDIILDEVVWVILRPYDGSGYMLNVSKLRLDDINFVIPFSSKLENPFIKLTDPRPITDQQDYGV